MPLTTLNMRGVSIMDAQLVQLRQAPLQSLNLSSRLITDDGVRTLVEGMPLATLRLEGCSGVTEGILATLAGLPLVYLYVDGGNFSDAGLGGLIQAVPSIKEVCVTVGGEGIPVWKKERKIMYGQASGSA